MAKFTVLAPGIHLFEAVDDQGNVIEGPNTLVSGGVHPNETEGIDVLNNVRQGLIDGTIQLTRGKVLCVLGNVDELQVAWQEGRPAARETKGGYNLNRLFGREADSAPLQAINSKEWTRAKIIETYTRGFNPDWHFDVHCTRKASELGAFAMVPFSQDAPSEELLDVIQAMGIDHAVLTMNDPERPQGTYSGYTSAEFGAKAATLELGELGSEAARAKVASVTEVIKALIEGSEQVLSKGGEATLHRWEPVGSVMKESDGFDFTRPLNTFSALDSGEVFARDGAQEYAFDGEGLRILFPSKQVEIGERAGVIVRQI